MQRLIETLKNKKQTALVISALQPGFLSLIKDPNGNHVIQRCLQCFSSEDSEVHMFSLLNLEICFVFMTQKLLLQLNKFTSVLTFFYFLE